MGPTDGGLSRTLVPGPLGPSGLEAPTGPEGTVGLVHPLDPTPDPSVYRPRRVGLLLIYTGDGISFSEYRVVFGGRDVDPNDQTSGPTVPSRPPGPTGEELADRWGDPSTTTGEGHRHVHLYQSKLFT